MLVYGAGAAFFLPGAGEEATQGTKSGYGNWLRNTVHEHKRNTTMTMFTNTQNVLFASVVEPPLFLAAPDVPRSRSRLISDLKNLIINK